MERGDPAGAVEVEASEEGATAVGRTAKVEAGWAKEVEEAAIVAAGTEAATGVEGMVEGVRMVGASAKAVRGRAAQAARCAKRAASHSGTGRPCPACIAEAHRPEGLRKGTHRHRGCRQHRRVH